MPENDHVHVNVATRRNLIEAAQKFAKSSNYEDLEQVSNSLAQIYTEILNTNCVLTIKQVK